ncbi:MAG TPA: C1 family peptidase [Cyclobacteriaceae bacterium]|nr:C1 family peptidase [Cyclobacteriaceae bacterium]
MMKYIVLLLLAVIFSIPSSGQSSLPEMTLVKKASFTDVKNQAHSGTCWSFSTTSLVESQSMHAGMNQIDLSEMYTVRNIYMEKARNYILRQGAAQFGAGGLGHDVIRAMAAYGAVPESVYSGLVIGQTAHDHTEMDASLKTYLDSLLRSKPIPSDWMKGFQSILDSHLGSVPETFTYNERQYTPKSFAADVLHFNPTDYVNITSFSHHPFYQSFILEAPDNFSNGMYYNLPLDEMIKLVEQVIEKGYSVMWDADVSNTNFRQRDGFAMQWENESDIPSVIDPDAKEALYNQSIRQSLYENLTTQDDHLMHLVGIEKSKQGKKFFLVKNSWGEVGPYKGFIHVSEAYFAINTVSLVIPKAAIDVALRGKLGIK